MMLLLQKETIHLQQNDTGPDQVKASKEHSFLKKMSHNNLNFCRKYYLKLNISKIYALDKHAALYIYIFQTEQKH